MHRSDASRPVAPYRLPLPCGCTVHVFRSPDTRVSHLRIIAFKGDACRVGAHHRGYRVFLWELLPPAYGGWGRPGEAPATSAARAHLTTPGTSVPD